MRIGRHMPTYSKMVKTAELAKQIGCEAIQIFASNPTGWQPSASKTAEHAAFAQTARDYQLDPVVIHAPYLINLGSPDATIWEKSIALLTWTMQRGGLLGAQDVIFHTGSHRGSGIDAGIVRVAQGIERVLQESPLDVMLLLENDVGAGNELGYCFEHIAAILTLLPSYQDRLGVCLDTAHLWGAGYDISNADSALQVLQRFDDIIGCSRLKVLHLNDTAMTLGSHRDMHTRLGEGIIGEEGLQTILRDPRLDHVAVLMETPIMTNENHKEDWVHDTGQIMKAKTLASKEVP